MRVQRLFMIGLIALSTFSFYATFRILQGVLDDYTKIGELSVNPIRPPLLLLPPQASNGFRSYADQCVHHCLSAYHAPSLHTSNSGALRTPIEVGDPPPRILHFIFLGDLEPGSHVIFTYMDYLVIRSAYFRLQPDSIYLHTNMPPLESPLWELIRPMIGQHHHLLPITQIYGNKVTGRAHFSDIARIQILQKYGGMYMDIDSICLRPFNNEMWDPPSGLAMGYETQALDHIGVGVITARTPNHFLNRWMESYKTFNDTKWADHTVIMAGKLAKSFPNEIDVFPEQYFYSPSWRPESFELLWKEHPKNDTNLFPFNETYAPHYWGSIARAKGLISRMTPQTILHENVALHQILRALLPFPYFSISLPCPMQNESHDGFEQALRSIVDQSFELWEIVLVESPSALCYKYTLSTHAPYFPRLKQFPSRHIRHIQRDVNESIIPITDAIWNVPLATSSTALPSPDHLYNILMMVHQNDSLFHGTQDGVHFQFVFDSSRGIHRIQQ